MKKKVSSLIRTYNNTPYERNYFTMHVSIVLAYVIVAWSRVRASVGINSSFNVVSYADDLSTTNYNRDNELVIISTPPPVIWNIRLIDRLRSGQFLTESKQPDLPQSNFDVNSFNLALLEHAMPSAKHLKITNKVQPRKFMETSKKLQKSKSVLKKWLTTSTTKQLQLSNYSKNIKKKIKISQNHTIKMHESRLKLSDDNVTKRLKTNKQKLKQVSDDMKLHFYQKLLRGYNHLNENNTTPKRKHIQPSHKTQIKNRSQPFIPLSQLKNSSVSQNYVFSVPHFDSLSHLRDWPRNPPRRQFRPLRKFVKPMLPPFGMFSPNFPLPTTLIRCRSGMITTLLNIHQCPF